MSTTNSAELASAIALLQAAGMTVTAPVSVAPEAPEAPVSTNRRAAWDKISARAAKREAQGHPAGRRASDREGFNHAVADFVRSEGGVVGTGSVWAGQKDEFATLVLDGSRRNARVKAARAIAEAWGVLKVMEQHNAK